LREFHQMFAVHWKVCHGAFASIQSSTNLYRRLKYD
jgi:hypothetical protein